MRMLRRIAVVTLVTMVLLSSRLLIAQDSSQQPTVSPQALGPTDQDISLLRKDLRSQKKQIVAANINLTDKESEQFWPVYEKYTDELMAINNKKYAAIKEYAQNYGTLTDDQAMKLTQQALEVDQSVSQLRQRYIPIFNKVVSGKKTAMFLQLDRRLVMLIDLQLSAAVPLVEQ